MGSLYALAVEGYHIFCSHKIKIIVDKMKDIVCGMEVNSKTIKSMFKGKNYYFCSDVFKRKFDKDRSKYIH